MEGLSLGCEFKCVWIYQDWLFFLLWRWLDSLFEEGGIKEHDVTYCTSAVDWLGDMFRDFDNL